MTRWRWITLSPELNLTLTLDSDDPELIERVEHSARENRITLVRVEEVPELEGPCDTHPITDWGTGT